MTSKLTWRGGTGGGDRERGARSRFNETSWRRASSASELVCRRDPEHPFPACHLRGIPCLHRGDTSRCLRILCKDGREIAQGGRCPYRHIDGRRRNLGRMRRHSLLKPNPSLASDRLRGESVRSLCLGRESVNWYGPANLLAQRWMLNWGGVGGAQLITLGTCSRNTGRRAMWIIWSGENRLAILLSARERVVRLQQLNLSLHSGIFDRGIQL